MKTFVVYFFVLILNASLVKGQERISAEVSDITIVPREPDPDHSVPIIKVLGRHFKTRLFESPKDHAYVFSISLAFDAEGKVDTVYFSDRMSAKLKSIIEPSAALLKDLKGINFKVKFNNKVLVLPLVIRRYNAQEIGNGVNFLNDLKALWPKLEGTDKTKALVLLDPFLNFYYPPISKVERLD